MASPTENPNPFKPPSPTNPRAEPPPFAPPASFANPPPAHRSPSPQGAYPFPPAPLPFHQNHLPFLHHPLDSLHHPTTSHPFASPHLPISNPNPNTCTSPNAGARLMALLNPSSAQLEPSFSLPFPSSTAPELPPSASAAMLHPIPSAMPIGLTMAQAVPARLPSSKMPRGRPLGGGDCAVYDVDSWFPGESQPPQLEVTPITKYISDPGLVLGRQISVNRTYICYGLKLGAIRVLNMKTALRALLKGHSQRVTDMTFFTEDVHLLASASVDGRVFVWKIDEGPDEENKPQITEKIMTALHIVGVGESYHPRICWHSHKQEILFVGIGNCILKIDTNKLGRGKEFSADEPLKCSVEKLIDGVQLIGKHEGEVTDLSISQWMITRIASASKDGTVKIWEDRKGELLATLRPHDGRPVHAVAFMRSPYQPEHINLITAGPLNRELKVWTCGSDEGWLLVTDSESWQCSQTLDLKSSSEPCIEEAFFNQIVVLPLANIIVIANAKKNSIYAVHVDYGQYPAATRMNYIADFMVRMPILSLTGISTNGLLPAGEQSVQLYCVQTQAIQQYALDLAQCLPPPDAANFGLEKDAVCHAFATPSSKGLSMLETSHGHTANSPQIITATSVLQPEISIINGTSAIPSPSNIVASGVSNRCESIASKLEDKTSVPDLKDIDGQHVSSFIPVNLDLTGSVTTVDRAVDQSNVKDESSAVSNHLLMLKPGGNTTRLITPSEILFGLIPPSEIDHVNQDLVGEEVKIRDMKSQEVDVSRTAHCFDPHKVAHKVAQAVFIEKSSHATEEQYEVENECSNILETCGGDGTTGTMDMLPSNLEEDLEYNRVDMPEKEYAATAAPQSLQAATAKKQKWKGCETTGFSSPLPFNSDFLNEPGINSTLPPSNAIIPQILVLQEMLNQVMNVQKEMQKQISVQVATPVTKEGKRLETTLGRCMEKAIKINTDALWARLQEDNGKRDRARKDQMQQITTLIANWLNKDLPATMEKILKKEISAAGPTIARAITPVIASAVAESFQRGVGDKAVSQLDKSVSSKLEAAVSRQIQTQLQTSGKQVIQDALRTCLEFSIVPAFEQSCKLMFEQIDSTFQKGLNEHTSSAQQQLEAAHSPLALTLRETINSASSITKNITTELIDGQRKLLALVGPGNTKVGNLTTVQQANGSMSSLPEMALSVQQVEAPMDPKKEVSRLISNHKYEDAFTVALQRNDVFLVSWLCTQVDLHAICCSVPLPLTQGVLLALVQHLACDITNETSRKVSWMTDVALQINPSDPTIASYGRPILEQVYSILTHQRSLPTAAGHESPNMRLVMHVINSVLASCK